MPPILIPMLTYLQAVAYLQSLIDYERTPANAAMVRYLNLERIRALLRQAGSPEQGLRFVHIAGTKGKGSTAAMTAQVLKAAGRRVGLYTSPHLLTFRERMRVNGEMIGEAAFARQMDAIVPMCEALRATQNGPPSFFEVLTLLAVRWFAEQQAEIVVLETGLGGRLDATNVFMPLATAITTLALDHQAELGETLEQIAGEKAGIIKPGVPVVSASQAPEAAEVLTHIAAEQGSPLYRVGETIRLLPGAQFNQHGQCFSMTLATKVSNTATTIPARSK